ncbi:polysaccharide deacetylase family protein [Aquibacillus sp. 3ASR75-11]|uniref:Polysaccharide deacetylase family protein n=1 Tax=Terrihalobacillus insolitus TaxID=2950438 RepID=A0A9X4AMQ9_9BACI|nr:polysaccharide deacetylase family protein [Terrihalobacillus insolitus]MDC3412778.1 polysaccharide deacetylase family protein [Terrihalobacillus insolitus]MDC3423745.1 polysaccharide deacetylase family protein [Terrihalobacillus insolitus]
MGKRAIITLFGFLFILSGCQTVQSISEKEIQKDDVFSTDVDKDKQEKEEQDVVKEDAEQDNKKDRDTTVDSPVKKEDVEPKYRVSDNWSLQPLLEESNEKIVLLTIDDGPDKYSLEMAKTLKSLNAEAIFFVNGQFLTTDKGKEALRKIAEMGFEIGNHTYSHKALWWKEDGQRVEMPEEEQKEEIVRVNEMVAEITGEKPKYFRAPFGKNTDFSASFVKKQGMILMNWTYGYDWNKEYMNETAIADIMVNTKLLSNGANLLMHDREWTANALEEIVVGLREKEFEIADPSLIQMP